METEIRDRPSFAHIVVRLQPGERIIAEADAMASMAPSIAMRTRFNGGVVQALLRRYFGGESMFVNEFSGDGELVLTQPFPGDIECFNLRGRALSLQAGAFIACEATVRLGVGWAGFASWIGGEGLFRLKITGHGKVWFGGYGGILRKEVEQEYVVDTGHLLAYEPSVRLGIGMSGGIFSSLFGGEGLVTRLYGPGRVYLQTRSLDGLAAWTNNHIR